MKRLAALLLVAVLSGCGPHAHGSPGPSGPYTAIGPLFMSADQLRSESKSLGTPIYWAGPEKGVHYEFSRTTLGYLFVRYVPKGKPVGAQPGGFLTVGTYPHSEAFQAVKQEAGGHSLHGPHGSVVYPRPKGTSVLLAFPRGEYEIEVFDPIGAVAKAIATSGQVRTVR